MLIWQVTPTALFCTKFYWNLSVITEIIQFQEWIRIKKKIGCILWYHFDIGNNGLKDCKKFLFVHGEGAVLKSAACELFPFFCYGCQRWVLFWLTNDWWNFKKSKIIITNCDLDNELNSVVKPFAKDWVQKELQLLSASWIKYEKQDRST